MKCRCIDSSSVRVWFMTKGKRWEEWMIHYREFGWDRKVRGEDLPWRRKVASWASVVGIDGYGALLLQRGF